MDNQPKLSPQGQWKYDDTVGDWVPNEGYTLPTQNSGNNNPQAQLSPGGQWKFDPQVNDWIPNEGYALPGQQSTNSSAVALIQKYFPQSQWNNAYQVMMGESGGRADAVGDNYPIRGETIPSYGLFQIRALPGRPAPQTLVNPEANVAYAAKLWKAQGGKWSPTWSAATKLGIQ